MNIFNERTCEERLDLVLLVKNHYADLVCRSSSLHLTKEDKHKKWKEIYDICVARKHKWTHGKSALYLQKTKWPGIKRDALARRDGCLTEVDVIVLELLNGCPSNKLDNFNSIGNNNNQNRETSKTTNISATENYVTSQICLDYMVTKASPQSTRSSSPVSFTVNNSSYNGLTREFNNPCTSLALSETSPTYPWRIGSINTHHISLIDEHCNHDNNNELQQHSTAINNLHLVDSNRKRKKMQNMTTNEIISDTDQSETDNMDFLLKKAKLKMIDSEIALNKSRIEANHSITLLNRAKLQLIYKSLQRNNINGVTMTPFDSLRNGILGIDSNNFDEWLKTL